MGDCCRNFKAIEHVVRNSVVIVVQHQKAIYKELARIEAALNAHKCDREPVSQDFDAPDFLKDLFNV